jgi:regulator of protease activity HflC (stomatin/prohibitin superfamily)
MNLPLLAGCIAGAFVVPAVYSLAKLARIEVEDGEAVLVTRFGKLARAITTPGWHWILDRVMPWVETIRVPLKRDFRTISEVTVNDARGTTVVVDVWLEHRVVDPARATFEVAEWEKSLENVVSHAVLAILGNREFREILCDRTELGEMLQREIAPEIERWGLAIDLVFIRNVSLLPEVSQQLFGSVAAQLERAKAEIEEEGRQRVALLEAETSRKVSKLLAEAKGQYPAAVARAFSELRDRPELLAAYEELHELSLLRPARVTALRGFARGEAETPADASLIAAAAGGNGG